MKDQTCAPLCRSWILLRKLSKMKKKGSFVAHPRHRFLPLKYYLAHRFPAASMSQVVINKAYGRTILREIVAMCKRHDSIGYRLVYSHQFYGSIFWYKPDSTVVVFSFRNHQYPSDSKLSVQSLYVIAHSLQPSPP